MYRDRIEFYQALERKFESEIPVCRKENGERSLHLGIV